jgi:hypothetical protein
MQKLSIITFFLLLCLSLFAQPSIMWQKCFGGISEDYGYSIQQTHERGFIVAGTTMSNDHDVSGNHGLDGWVVELDSAGVIEIIQNTK